MFSSHSGSSDWPYPGWSGTSTSKRCASFSMNGSTTGAPLAPCRKTSGAPLPPRRKCVRQPSIATVWSVNGMGELATGDAGLDDHRGDLGEVHRRHDVRAGDAGNLGELAQHFDADRAPLTLRVGRVFQARDVGIRDDGAEELFAHPACRARRRYRRDTDQERNLHAALVEARDVAPHHLDVHAELRLHEVRASGDLRLQAL